MNSYLIRSLIAILLYTVCSTGCKNSQETNPIDSSPIDPRTNEDSTSIMKVSTPYDMQYLMGHFDPKMHKDFTEIPTTYADQKSRYMHMEALDSFVKMWEHAQRDGISLRIKSAVRNFDYQKGIWERKWTGATILSDGTNVAEHIKNDLDKAAKILEYSSMPGTSRHHWGTDIDLNAFNNTYFEQGEGLKVYQWLQTHADKYGYGQPYTTKNANRPNGYNEEKWHWSYLPIAKPLTDLAQYHFQDSLISGFLGASTAVDLQVKNNYILGIAQDCL